MEKYIILGHENPDIDSIISGVIYENYLRRKGHRVEFIIPDQALDEDTINLCLKYSLNPKLYQRELTYNKETKFILLDHYKRENIGEVVQIIDHHPTTEQPNVKNYINKSSSSTTCLLVRGNESDYTEREIELACLAAMVDTASFNSTKSTLGDRLWVISMCNKYGFDINELYEDGLCLTNINNIEKASFNGLKKYNYNGYNIESSYIQIKNITEQKEKIIEMIETIKNYKTEKDLEKFIFIVHDMEAFKTTTYEIGETDVTTKNYPQYTSRGNTIMPEIEAYYNSFEPNQLKIKTSTK